MTAKTTMITPSKYHLISAARLRTLAIVFLICWTVLPAVGADEPAVVTKTKEAVTKAGRSAADQVEQLWNKIDAARLKNRTKDEIVAWVIMGALVGAVAGMMTNLKPSGLGKAGRLLLGLTGAFLGGIVLRVSKLDFGWGVAIIRYEELTFSLVGAILLLMGSKFLRSRSKAS